MIQLNDQKYWLYATVAPDSNNLSHTQPEPMRNDAIADQLLAELRKEHDADDRPFSSMARPLYSEPVANTISTLDTNDMEIGIVLNVYSVRKDTELPVSRTFY